MATGEATYHAPLTPVYTGDEYRIYAQLNT